MTTLPPASVGSERFASLQVLILGAGFNTDNRGVAALACGTLAAIYDAFPRAQVDLLDYSKTPAAYTFEYQKRRHLVGFVALRFSKNLLQPNHVVRLLCTALWLRLFSASQRAERIARNPWLARIARADVVGALSGGDSFSDLYGLRRLLYVALPQLLVLALRQRLILLPQSYGPFHRAPGRCLARFILRRAHRVYTRDEGGIDAMRRLDPSVADRMLFAFDMGFALEPRAPSPDRLSTLATLKQRGPVVGLNVSGLLYFSSRAGRNPFGLRSAYKDLLCAIIAQLVRDYQSGVLLIPHVFGFSRESDSTAALALLRHLPADVADVVTVAEGVWDQHEVKYIIGQCDVFIGARMHACIAALSQSVPTVALAYSDKFAGVLRSIGGRDVVVDLRTCDQEQALAAIARTFEHRVIREFELAARTPAVRRKVLGFFRSLEALNRTPHEPVTIKSLPPELDPSRPATT